MDTFTTALCELRAGPELERLAWERDIDRGDEDVIIMVLRTR